MSIYSKQLSTTDKLRNTSNLPKNPSDCIRIFGTIKMSVKWERIVVTCILYIQGTTLM